MGTKGVEPSLPKSQTINKVKKLLRLADGTPYEEEAFSALLKAQEILLGAGLTMGEGGDLDDEEDEERVVQETLEDGMKSASTWKLLITQPICENFRVTPCVRADDYGGSRMGSKLVLIGLETDVEVCKETLMFAFGAFTECFRRFLTKWKKESSRGRKGSRSLTMRIRNDYLKGFVSGLENRFREQVESKALVLTQDALVINYVNNLKTTNGAKRTLASFGDETAYSQGYRDGKSLDHTDLRSEGGVRKEIEGS